MRRLGLRGTGYDSGNSSRTIQQGREEFVDFEDDCAFRRSGRSEEEESKINQRDFTIKDAGPEGSSRPSGAWKQMWGASSLRRSVE
ncbi:hypothetical protein GWI33_017092 [Rhynchophorus ferrugineus]|uniref:Uncharacterized protein n=1 Tax=Rhynchophorus ferrugineus TaxID=354439 RepID=A0A834HZS1_RHYFE|nr:hypothetical protein GWI33_017092 [Rhynchophorus ferrugineus]